MHSLSILFVPVRKVALLWICLALIASIPAFAVQVPARAAGGAATPITGAASGSQRPAPAVSNGSFVNRSITANGSTDGLAQEIPGSAPVKPGTESVTAHSGGGGSISFPAGVSLFSVPYTFAGGSLDSIFGYAGVSLQVYDPLLLQYVVTPTPPADQLRLGTGYWARFPTAVTLSGGTPADQTQDFVLNLEPGWNEIGDPFTSNVSISSMYFNGETFAAASTGTAPIVGAQFDAYNTTSGAYVTTTTLSPGLGYLFEAFSPVSMIIPAPIPAAPNGLTAVAGNSSVSLAWAGLLTDTGYEVHMGTAPGAESATPITVVTGTQTTVSGLTNGTTYYFTVVADNVNGKSAFSNEASAVPGTVAPPATFLVGSAGDSSAVLNWSIASGAVNYNVYQGTISHGESTSPVATTTGNSANVGNLVNGNTYYFDVAYMTTAGTSLISNEVSATPGIAPPGDLRAVPGIGQTSLNWIPVSGISSYHVKRSTTSGTGYTVIATVTGTSYADTTAANDTTYYYAVTSLSSGGIEGRNSIERSATPEPAPTEFASPPGGGATAPWERSMDGVNLLNGNLLTSIPIVSWTARGGFPIDISMVHNSQSTVTAELGPKWTLSYDMSLSINSSTGDITITASDGKSLLFLKHQSSGWGSQFMPPPGVHEGLVSGNGGYDLTSRDSNSQHRRVSHFSQIGTSWLLTKVSDAQGNATVVNHNAAGLVTSVVDPTSRSATFTYNTNNTLSSITDPLGRIWTIAYDASGNLSSVTWPSVTQGTQSFTPDVVLQYTPSHDIASYTGLGGSTKSYTYFNSDAVASVTDPVGYATSISYSQDATQNFTTVIDPNGNRTEYAYSDGAVTSVTDATGFSELYTYADLPDFVGGTGTPSYPPSYSSQCYNVSVMTDKESDEWAYAYDNEGNVVWHSNLYPDKTKPVTTLYHMTQIPGLPGSGTVFTTQYITTTREGGAQETDSYNTNDLWLTRKLPSGTETYTYNSNGLRISDKDANNNVTSYAYDANGNMTSTTDANNHVTTYTYNGLGWKLTQVDALGDATKYVYDNWGRVISVIAPDLSATSTVYDLNSNTVSTTDANNSTIAFTYDAENRKLASTTALGHTSRSSYDDFGQKGLESRWTDGDGNVTFYGYTARNEKNRVSYPDGTAEYSFYSPCGNPTEHIKRDGTLIDQTYNTFKKLTSIAVNGTLNSTFTYDTDHRRIGMVDPTGTTTWTYDTTDRVTSATSPSGSVAYSYDAADRKTKMTVTGIGSWSYTYDGGNRLTSVTNPYSEKTSYLYDNANRMTQETFGSGMVGSFSYDVNSRTTKVSYATGSNVVIGSYIYAYDAASRETQRTDSDGSVTSFGYDSDNQLVSEVRTGLQPYSDSYAYDLSGNRINRNLGGSTDSYSYVNNRLVSITGSDSAALSYDPNGNLITMTLNGATVTHAYDAFDHMISCFLPSTTDRYVYNGMGQRVGITDSLGSRTVLSDGCVPASPVLSDQFAVYTPGISERRAGATSYYMLDEEGSARALANSSQVVTNSYLYDAFGRTVSKSGSDPNPFGYVSKSNYQTDSDTMLMLLGQRYYSPDLGRFITQDPSGRNGGPNLYEYCMNSPVMGTDPTGQNPLAGVTAQDIGDGFATGWAGWSTAVWSFPGLSNLNAKYSVYSAGAYANEPGFTFSVASGTFATHALATAAGLKGLSMIATVAPFPGTTGTIAQWWDTTGSIQPGVLNAIKFEAGQATLPNSMYDLYGEIPDPLDRFAAMYASDGVRAYFPYSFNFLLSGGKGRTLGTGPSPLGRPGLQAAGLGTFLLIDYFSNQTLYNAGAADAWTYLH